MKNLYTIRYEYMGSTYGTVIAADDHQQALKTFWQQCGNSCAVMNPRVVAIDSQCPNFPFMDKLPATAGNVGNN